MYENSLAERPVRTANHIKVHGPEGFEGMRKAGRLAAECLDMLIPHVQPGVSTGYLDDLFVDPDLRGAGIADDLFAAAKELGRSRDWSVIRWITAENNYRARGVYDRVAARTNWITYDLKP